MFNFLSFHQKENPRHPSHPSSYEPTTQSASAVISQEQFLLRLADGSSLLMALCVVSEVFNHNSDCITEEIIVLLTAESLPAASPPADSLTLIQGRNPLNPVDVAMVCLKNVSVIRDVDSAEVVIKTTSFSDPLLFVMLDSS
ncbi:hypothetical protein Q8A73_000508 [Channa argus]|nr:hypothetical protein Q8A73_000508 [Channa argus]